MTDAKILLQQAMTLYQNGHLPEAGKIYADLLAEKPELVPARIGYGYLLIQLGDHSRAEQHFSTASSIAPDNINAHLGLGRARFKSGKSKLAKVAFEQALKLEPDSYPALVGMGRVLIALENFTQALEMLLRAEPLGQELPSIYLHIGTAQRGLGDAEAAIISYTKALELDPDNMNAHYCLADLYRDKHDFLSAEPHYRRVIDLGALRSDIEVGLGFTLLHNGKEEEAGRHFFRGVEIDPTSQSAYIGLDMYLLRSGGPEKKRFIEKLREDYIYPDWQESVRNAKRLASLTPYPDEHATRALESFFDEYQPGELHSPDWWEQQLARFGPAASGHDKILRSVHSIVFSWSLPDSDTLAQIAEFTGNRRVSSYGAGGGFWERLLTEHFGVEVMATDTCLRHRFAPMTVVDYATCTAPDDDTIFLSWIQGGDTAVLNLLQQLQGGQKLVLVGEPPTKKGPSFICGSTEMFDYLHNEFELQQTLPLVSYSLLNDTVSFLIKK